MGVPKASEARVEYFAGRDFNEPRLTVPKGAPLPDKWQMVTHVRWLRQKYGEDAVVTGGLVPDREFVEDDAAKAMPGWVTGPRRKDARKTA